ncbi:MAG: hypothetical protein ACOYX1_14130 [Acidobacteriota bacterium]
MRYLLMTIGCGILAAALLPAQGLAARQGRQQARITQGARSGALTPGETALLERQQARIRQKIRQDRIDGSGLTPRERAKAGRMLDHSSRAIHRLKHNARTR